MSKKNNALSEENLGQVSGGAVRTADGTKLTGKHANLYVEKLIGKQGGGKSTPIPPPVDSIEVFDYEVEPLESSDGSVVVG